MQRQFKTSLASVQLSLELFAAAFVEVLDGFLVKTTRVVFALELVRDELFRLVGNSQSYWEEIIKIYSVNAEQYNHNAMHCAYY